MSRLKLLPYGDLARVAEAAGFDQVIVRSLLRKIIRDMGLTVDEYNRLVDSL